MSDAAEARFFAPEDLARIMLAPQAGEAIAAGRAILQARAR